MIGNSTSNGQLIAAVVFLVDAVFGVLIALNVVHVKPDTSIVAIAVTAAFNIGGYVWAFIQHQQHVVKLQIAGGVAAQRGAVPPAMQGRR